MSADTVEVTARIRALEAEVAVEYAKRRIGLRFGLEQAKPGSKKKFYTCTRKRAQVFGVMCAMPHR